MQALKPDAARTGLFRVHAFAFAPDARVWQTLRAEGGEHGLTDLKNSSRRFEGNKAVFAFSFGAMAFWDYSFDQAAAERDRILQDAGLHPKLGQFKVEDFVVEIEPEAVPRVEFNKIVLERLTLERIELISLTVAQSAAMEYYEGLIEQIRTEVALMVGHLADRGRVAYSAKKLQRTIGHVILIRNDIVGVLHLLDKPDLCWEDKTMDVLYEDFRAVFDLEERYLAFQYKLTSIQDTLEILLETFRSRRSFLVEVLILLFIAVEILIASKSAIFALLEHL